MTIRSISSVDIEKNKLQAPICVIGAGLAGLLLARRLAQAGQRVIVLESGGEAVADDVSRLNEIDDPARRYTRATTGRYRGLGGSSSRWGGRMIPIGEHETSARTYISGPDWPFPVRELAKYEDEIQALFGVAPGSFEDIATERDGRPHAFPRGEPSLTPRWAKCPSFKNCNIATLLADDLRNSELLDIWLDATVCEFDLDRESGRLAGVLARDLAGHALHVRADRFVFAAGTIETTRLLLLLDEASDNRAFEGCNVLGRYFQDHLKAEVATIGRNNPTLTNRLFGYRFVDGTRRDLHLELAHQAQERDRVASAFVYVAMDLAASPLSDIKKLAQGLQRRQFDFKAMGRASRNLGLLTQSAWWRIMENQLFVPADIALRLMVCVEQLPHWDNRIRLSQTRDSLGKRLALFEWAPTQADEDAFQATVAALAAYWQRAGFDRQCPLEWNSSIDKSSPIIAKSEACAHPSGSTRMGTDPGQSVVGPDLRCHAVPNIAVASASVFPTAGSANPTFTIMRLAMWLADSILGEQRAVRTQAAPLVSA